MNEDAVECEATHLTSFSVLVTTQGNGPHPDNREVSLSMCPYALPDCCTLRLCLSSLTLAVVYQYSACFLQCLQLHIGGTYRLRYVLPLYLLCITVSNMYYVSTLLKCIILLL